MADPRCTATVGEDGTRPNILFTPPCTCPDCAPQRTYEQAGADGWLRISGDRQRYRVEDVELGELGRAVLG